MTTQTTTPMMNGYDIGRLMENLGAMKMNPGMAKTQFRAVNRWMNGTHNRSIVQGYSLGNTEQTDRDTAFVTECDAPGALLGTNKGASPLEHLLGALVACLTTTVVINAAARGITIHSIKSTCDGNLDLRGMFALDETVPCGLQSIDVKFDIRADASDDEIQTLIENAMKYAPMLSTLQNPPEINVNLAEIA